MADKPVARGRGALLEKLKQHKEKVGLSAQEAEKSPPKPMGRAALLEKLQRQKEMKVGIGAGPSGEPERALAEAGSSKEPPRGPTHVEKLTKQASELSVASLEPCFFRGTSGTPLRSTANYINLEVEKDRGVYEYEVRFRPDIDARSNRIRLVNQALGEMATTKVYDGDACLYMPSQYIVDREEFPNVIPNTTEEVTTVIIYKRKRKMHECLHLYNVLFKRIMHILLYNKMGRNYFSPEHKNPVPQHKLEIFPGFAITVDEVEDGLKICLDTQHRVIRSQTAYEMLQEYHAANPRNFKDVAMQNIVGSVVLNHYNNKTHTVTDIAWDTTPKDTFEGRGGVPTTFIEYYKRQYNIDISDIDQPLLVSKVTKTIGGVRQENLICLVPELSYLTGLTDAMRSDFKVMKDVASFTRVTPQQRMNSLRTYLDKVRKSEAAQKVLAGWGLKIANDTVRLDARVLPPEAIYFGGGGNPEAHKYVGGTDWNKAVGENKVTGPIDIMNWQLYYTQRDERNAQNFAQTITRLATGMGCRIRDPQLIRLPDDRTETYAARIKENVTRDVQVAVFICPTLRTDRYSIIKKLLCTSMPIASQVVLSKTLGNPQKVRTIIHKIALQIECKLGGTLWNVKIPATGWMVCGIDVYHGGVNAASVCGFVCSLNDSMTRWYSEALFQDKEIGNSYMVPFSKALAAYYSTTGAYPSKLIIIRDGVGDGQLDWVKKHELPQFEDVIKEMGLETTVTFIVVQKRINTRIFRLTDGSNCENPPAGTVVDSIITRKYRHDFFLVPQSVRQGTVNPTHYIVLYDSADIKPDIIQRLTYKLCHLYYNWSGTIRVPAPCQYAHKLAALVGQYIKKTPSPELNDKLFYL